MTSEAGKPELSIVVPVYNEAGQVLECLERLGRWLDHYGRRYEILVVVDGSRDDSEEVVRGYAEANARVRVIAYRPNRGKGFAVRTGLRAARGEYVLFTDADLSTPPLEIGPAVELLAQHDVVVGSRARPHSRLVVRQRWYREWMGRTFNLLVRLAGLSRMPDTQCGFKAFRGAVLPALLAPLGSNRFAFDVELLSVAEEQGLRIVEQPVEWHNRANSSVRLLRDAAGMFVELAMIAIRAVARRRRSA